MASKSKIKNNIRLRFSSREAATLRISIMGRINRLSEALKVMDKTSDAYKQQSEMLDHFFSIYNRLHEATYGKKA
jgi:hypothetical protein